MTDESNEFDRLVENLKSGKLSLKTIEIAIKAHYEESKFAHEETKDLISNIISNHFSVMRQTIGAMELAALRIKQGKDD